LASHQKILTVKVMPENEKPVRIAHPSCKSFEFIQRDFSQTQTEKTLVVRAESAKSVNRIHLLSSHREIFYGSKTMRNLRSEISQISSEVLREDDLQNHPINSNQS
jgi:hypothetical protein